MPIVLYQLTCCHKKWRKNCHSNLALETGGFSTGGTTSLLLLKSRHNTLYCMPVTNQYNSRRIYFLLYTLVWQVWIKTEFIVTDAENFWNFWLGQRDWCWAIVFPPPTTGIGSFLYLWNLIGYILRILFLKEHDYLVLRTL